MYYIYIVGRKSAVKKNIASFAGSLGANFHLRILLLKRVELGLKLFDLAVVFVLNTEIVHLYLDVANLSSEPILLLLVSTDSIEHAL